MKWTRIKKLLCQPLLYKKPVDPATAESVVIIAHDLNLLRSEVLRTSDAWIAFDSRREEVLACDESHPSHQFKGAKNRFLDGSKNATLIAFFKISSDIFETADSFSIQQIVIFSSGLEIQQISPTLVQFLLDRRTMSSGSTQSSHDFVRRPEW